jgi:hypothetical protein
MTLIEIVILAGAQCLSPVQEARGTTEVGKVPCAVLIRMDQKTGDVEFTPPAAATDPKVIAMLLRSATVETASAAADPGPGKRKPVARTVGSRKVERAAAVAKKQRRARRGDACGSMKASWYTNKQGRRKYRCVRQG